MYLSAFYFPGEEAESDFMFGLKTTYDQSVYPYGILPKAGLNEIIFRPVTILYGGNGSGKSTALNVIAEKLRLERIELDILNNFKRLGAQAASLDGRERLALMHAMFHMDTQEPFRFDWKWLVPSGLSTKDFIAPSSFEFKDTRMFRMGKKYQARSKTKSRFIENESGKSLRERSNGENAIMFFQSKIEMDTLCLLDEPENSLSPENQLVLADFLSESVRYCGNQLVISTHSPFLLALPGAKIIDLDHHSRIAESWTQLKNPRVYYDFFKKHEHEFE